MSGSDAARVASGLAGVSDGGSTVTGLLEIPALRLVAPVLQGTSDAVLSDAVGHVPASAWPGWHPGTSVFSVHDITWFPASIGCGAVM